jgi:hypothetical protein
MTPRTYHLGRSSVLLFVYLVGDGDWITLDVCCCFDGFNVLQSLRLPWIEG